MSRLTFFALLLSGEALGLNGLRPIGVSAASRSQGGTGVSSFYNVFEAVYKNPSLLSFSSLEDGQIESTFGLTYGSFTPRVRATYGEDQEYKQPQGDGAAFFPSGIAVGQRVSSRWSWGAGFYGGGGGADYSDAQSVYRARSRTLAFSLSPAFSYAIDSHWSFGANGSISAVDTFAANESITKGTMVETGGQDTTIGGLFGISYQKNSLTFGAIIQPKQVAFLEDARDIDEDGYQDNLLFAAVPWEYALGVSWQEPLWRLSADYRFLQWSDADFLSTVGWRDQHVLAMGFSFGGRHAIRLGANFSTDAVVDKFDEDGFATRVASDKPLINLASDAFAATSALGVTNRHYTIGSLHQLLDNLRLETAFVHMDTGSLERAGSYKVPTGTKTYGWRSEFTAYTMQTELTYQW